MSNSHEQSLNEDIVFLPVTETSPDFLYSERERLAVERLLNAGPEAFYSTVGIEHSSCFLSPEEVTEITSWAQDYHLSPVQKEENGEDGPGLDEEDFSSTYFPMHSDTPAPDLVLGWPERSPWAEKDSVRVYTSPPAAGEPSVRELVRQQLQTASQLIAIVTDRLTDCAVIGDLHSAASRGVPVYIVLNQRSAQENSTLNRLWHPNMQVRVLGGKSFCSRAGRMVAGEMKDKFVLVDLQTVIHGSYSLTWTDAHLHRQLVTVLTGSVVDSFDREFRILFAASSPVPDARRMSCASITQCLQDFPDMWLPKHLPLDAEIINPPSPPSDTLLDWEAMGVIPGGSSVPNSPFEQHEDVFLKERPQLNNVMLDKKPVFVDNFFSNKHLNLDKKRLSEPPPPPSPVVNYMSHLLTPLNIPHYKWKEPLNTEMRTETSKPQHKWKEPPNTEMRTETRIEPKVEIAVARQISTENSKYLDDKYLKRHEKESDPGHNAAGFSHIKQRQDIKEGATGKEETGGSKNGPVFKMENTPSSRKPVILRVPHSEDPSSLSDIMKRMKQKQSTWEPQRDRANTAFPELSRSMMDVSGHSADQGDKGSPVPRFRASILDVEQVTPALALMQKRNDLIRTSMYRPLLSLQPRGRPHSFAFGSNWRKSLSELEGQEEGH